MPGGDGTGPNGLGPIMGRGWNRRTGTQVNGQRGGNVGGFNQPRPCGGRGRRQGNQTSGAPNPVGRTGGREERASSNQQMTAESELDYLKNYASGLEESLNAIRARIAEMQDGQRTTQTS